MSFQDKLPNGASVNRLFASNNEGEMLGLFQYSNDAESFAAMKLAEDASRRFLDSTYVVSCTYSGRIKVYRHKKVEEAVS